MMTTISIISTVIALTASALGIIITIKRKPLEITLPKWMEWVQRLVEFKF